MSYAETYIDEPADVENFRLVTARLGIAKLAVMSTLLGHQAADVYAMYDLFDEIEDSMGPTKRASLSRNFDAIDKVKGPLPEADDELASTYLYRLQDELNAAAARTVGELAGYGYCEGAADLATLSIEEEMYNGRKIQSTTLRYHEGSLLRCDAAIGGGSGLGEISSSEGDADFPAPDVKEIIVYLGGVAKYFEGLRDMSARSIWQLFGQQM